MDTKLVKDLTSNRNFLVNFVREWNESRLDMFALSQPNEVCPMFIYYHAQSYHAKATLFCLHIFFFTLNLFST